MFLNSIEIYVYLYICLIFVSGYGIVHRKKDPGAKQGSVWIKMG